MADCVSCKSAAAWVKLKVLAAATKPGKVSKGNRLKPILNLDLALIEFTGELGDKCELSCLGWGIWVLCDIPLGNRSTTKHRSTQADFRFSLFLYENDRAQGFT
jgi:hypothetical protein